MSVNIPAWGENSLDRLIRAVRPSIRPVRCARNVSVCLESFYLLNRAMSIFDAADRSGFRPRFTWRQNRMDKDIYLKLIVLGAVLIVALLSPILSALALTVVGWNIKDKRIADIPAVKRLIEAAPPSVKEFFNTK